MTRRERLEAKIARRQEWAEKAAQRSTQRFHAAHTLADQIPLGQPILVGHHSERHARRDAERIQANMTRGVEAQHLAEHHAAKADGIKQQLDRSVFSDDVDAMAQLEARIAENESRRDRMKAINAAIRKGGPGWEAQLQPPLTEAEKTELMSLAHAWAGVYKSGFPSYALTNLGARIRADKERLAELEARAIRTEQAEAAGVLIEGDEYLRVTFPEKPERATLEALRAAGFRWSQGSWYGSRAALPEAVAALAE